MAEEQSFEITIAVDDDDASLQTLNQLASEMERWEQPAMMSTFWKSLHEVGIFTKTSKKHIVIAAIPAASAAGAALRNQAFDALVNAGACADVWSTAAVMAEQAAPYAKVCVHVGVKLGLSLVPCGSLVSGPLASSLAKSAPRAVASIGQHLRPADEVAYIALAGNRSAAAQMMSRASTLLTLGHLGFESVRSLRQLHGQKITPAQCLRDHMRFTVRTGVGAAAGMVAAMPVLAAGAGPTSAAVVTLPFVMLTLHYYEVLLEKHFGNDPDGALKKAHETLGLQAPASKAEIRNAYLTIARTAHPDHGGETEKFVCIKAAYDLLMQEQELVERAEKFVSHQEQVDDDWTLLNPIEDGCSDWCSDGRSDSESTS